jgi:hypothetical protein
LRQIACRNAKDVWQSGRRFEKCHVSGNYARIIINDDRKPVGAPARRWRPQSNIEQRMIGLPESIWRFRAVPVNEFIAVAESRLAFMRQGCQCRIEAAHNGMDNGIRRRGDLALRGDLCDLAVQRRNPKGAACAAPALQSAPRNPTTAARQEL